MEPIESVQQGSIKRKSPERQRHYPVDLDCLICVLQLSYKSTFV